MAGKNPLDALNASNEEEEKKAQEATKAFAAQMAAANKPATQPTPAAAAPVAYRPQTYTTTPYTDPNFGDTGGASGIGNPRQLDARDRGGQKPVSDVSAFGYGVDDGGGNGYGGGRVPNTSGGTGADGAGGTGGGGTKPPATVPDAAAPKTGGGGGGAPPPPKVMPYDGPYIKQGAAWDDAKTQAYYKANPDVAKAVAAGKMEDAQSHYEKHGKQEGRSFAEAAAAQVPVAKANNDKLQAELDALKAEKANAAAKADIENKNAEGRTAAVSGLTPRISGVDQWGAQLVDFGGGNPKGVTLTDAELRGIASKAGYGYETVAQGWKNAGGKVGDDKSWAGMLDLPKTPAAGAAPAPFDSAGYLKNNPDVAAAIANGTFKGTAKDHYDQFGKNEVRAGGREATAGEREAAAAAKTFDSAKYLADNPDVAKAISNGTFRGNAFDHYWQFGRNEVRPGGRAFTPAEIAERDTWGNQGDGNPSNPMTPVPGGPTGAQNPATPATTPPATTLPTTPGPMPINPRTGLPFKFDDPRMPIGDVTAMPIPNPNPQYAEGPVTGINGSVGAVVGGIGPTSGPMPEPRMSIGGVNTMPEPRMSIGGVNTMPFDPRTGLPYTPNDFTPNYPVYTPQRDPAYYAGIRPPENGDFDGNGNIWAAERGGGGRWVPYTPATPPPVLPRNEAPLPPTITTGQNADSNSVVAGRLIETLPGGADVWEYNDIENVVMNRWTGERRAVPSASVGPTVGGIGPTSGPFERQPVGVGPNGQAGTVNTMPEPRMSIGGVNTMPEPRMSIGGVNTMPFNPRTGLPYTPADFTPNGAPRPMSVPKNDDYIKTPPNISGPGMGGIDENGRPFGNWGGNLVVGIPWQPGTPRIDPRDVMAPGPGGWTFDPIRSVVINNATGEELKV